jgi:hypothetical protein
MAARPSAWLGGSLYRGNEPRLAYQAKGTGEFAIEIPSRGGVVQRQRLPVSTLIVFDWLAFMVGMVQFQPRFNDKFMAPYGQVVTMPPDPTTYVEALRLPAYVSEYGKLDWLITSKIALNRTRLWYEEFGYCGEAQQMLLAVYAIEESKPVELSTWDDLFFEPIVTRKGWIERDPDTFGPVKVPPPPPILPSTAPPIALPAAPANDEVAPYRPVPTPAAATPVATPSATPQDAPKPANDLLATFRKRNF